MDYRLEVVGIPVRDVDTSIDFYVNKVGFHLDHDIEPATGGRCRRSSAGERRRLGRNGDCFTISSQPLAPVPVTLREPPPAPARGYGTRIPISRK